MKSAWVIAIGTELTLGQTVDTNSAWLAERLGALGFRTVRHMTVPDELEATREAVLQAAERCDVIVMSGGLGPTDDDLTRAALAAAAGVPLELHGPSVEHLRAFFAARGREMPARNTVQAMMPRGATVLPNTCGTAPGVMIELHGTPCYSLPGVPFEMRAMFGHEVEPRLRAASGGEILLCRRVHTFGLGESIIGEKIRDLMQRGRNPEVGTTAEFGIVGIRINATGQTPDAAQTMLNRTEAEIRRRLGGVVFGVDEDTLAGVVGGLLSSMGCTVSTAESCTGGLIAALLTDIPGSSRYFTGGIIAYANDAKEKLLGVRGADLATHGAVSAAVACGMADGAAAAFGTDYALSATGIAGPTGGTAAKPVGLVFIGLHGRGHTVAHECRLGSDSPREAVRLRAARTALDLLRRASLTEQATCGR